MRSQLEARLAKDRSEQREAAVERRADAPAAQDQELAAAQRQEAGGQLGHRGETLRLVATPEVVLEHRPAVCAGCQASLEDAAVVGRERRQVCELPPLRLVGPEDRVLA